MAPADHELPAVLRPDAAKTSALRTRADPGDTVQASGLETGGLTSAPDHIFRRDQPAACNQDCGYRDVRTGLCEACENQKQGREQRRRIGGSAQHANVAAL